MMGLKLNNSIEVVVLVLKHAYFNSLWNVASFDYLISRYDRLTVDV